MGSEHCTDTKVAGRKTVPRKANVFMMDQSSLVLIAILFILPIVGYWSCCLPGLWNWISENVWSILHKNHGYTVNTYCILQCLQPYFNATMVQQVFYMTGSIFSSLQEVLVGSVYLSLLSFAIQDWVDFNCREQSSYMAFNVNNLAFSRAKNTAQILKRVFGNPEWHRIWLQSNHWNQ